MSTNTKQHIEHIGTVFLPVTDQDKSIEFYRDKLGFELRTDTTFGEGYRWVEVAPPGAQTVLALVTPEEGGALQPGCNSPMGFDTEDLDAAVADMREKGVEFDGEIMRMGDPVPPMIYFFDPDRNRTLLVQADRVS
jgi:catechol 2,3-dioxygenase-like lactoylglutathione lyase family enzyme